MQLRESCASRRGTKVIWSALHAGRRLQSMTNVTFDPRNRRVSDPAKAGHFGIGEFRRAQTPRDARRRRRFGIPLIGSRGRYHGSPCGSGPIAGRQRSVDSAPTCRYSRRDQHALARHRQTFASSVTASSVSLPFRSPNVRTHSLLVPIGSPRRCSVYLAGRPPTHLIGKSPATATGGGERAGLCASLALVKVTRPQAQLRTCRLAEIARGCAKSSLAG